ncbi:MAG TPA: hypothetical protein VKV04_01625 [Verrucomicrobiae bacterium]|nr:hypothetical protein [Verrucomicrobiae bacterium]
MPTRRRFFASCTALAVTVSIAPTVALSAPFRSRQLPLEDISFPDFLANVNTRFAILSQSRPAAELWLAQVKRLDAPGLAVASFSGEHSENFSLLFAGEQRAALLSDIYDFEHERIGRFQMFIAPVGPAEPGACYYEAIFNRPIVRDRRNGMTDFRRLRS